jgi:integrase
MRHGCHAFRRGLASTLYGLGADDVMVQQILRHEEVQVTRNPYIETGSQQSIAAMRSWSPLWTHRAQIVR